MTRRGGNPVTRREFLAEGSGVALGVGFGLSGEWQIAQSPGLSVSNDLMRAEWSLTDGVLRGGKVTDLTSGATLALPPDLFSLQLQDGSVIPATALRVVKTSTHTLGPQSRASRLAERLPGRELLVTLRHPDGRLRATWHAILRDGSRYLRQEVQLEALGHDLPVSEIRMLELNVAGGSGPEIAGSVRGSPAVSGDWFFGFEHPLSESRVDGSRVRCILTRELPLRVGTAVTGSSVIGVAPRAQRRRAFLGYVERERAHPYRPFLHYNSWYDIGYFSSFDEAAALAVIEAFGTELHQRRSVMLDSFLFDDGWDDHQTLWHFNRGFPRGFTQVREAAARYGAAPGVWLSPWGGYGKPHDERIAAGKAQGYETIGNGFALSGPAYYRRFRETCLEMIHKYGVNQFKFDGTGNAAHVFPGSLFDSDFDAMLALIADLRHERPDLYVNLTTGTYPSPFFLRSCDSIWRGGEDHDFAGVGSDRQRWITYRDADTYAGIVQKGPLFPLNSLMLHGLIYARHAHNLDTDPQRDFAAEIHAYFGTGTQLQEMYVSPGLLTSDDWDTLAETASWARRNAGVLVDTHWIGGDPAALEPYGHAAWVGTGKLGSRAMLCLRNPKDEEQEIDIDVAEAFELPDGAPPVFTMRSPWRADANVAPVVLQAGAPHQFVLRPFEVLTLEAV